MTDLLFQPSPARGPNDYEVIADDWIVGRIVLSDASPAERPWMWSLDHEFYQGRERTYGYEATREGRQRSWLGRQGPPIGLAQAYLSGMEKDLQIRLLEELERAWLKCLPCRQAAARSELMLALPTELARRSAGH